jgi:DNA-directed RNA polymerase I and III subunit RPAC1
MKHASDKGALPANVEAQRTRVSVHTDAPRHTSTVEYAGAYFASGVDNSFSMERFKRDFKIEIQSLDEEEMVFDMIGIDPAIANAFRRILLSEVPTMAIEKVFILNNTSMIQDEMLSHRLGLIPIKADPRLFRERGAEDDADEHNVISFRLQIKCGKANESGFQAASSSGSASGSGGGPAGVVNSQVLSKELKWIPQGDQESRFKDDPIRPVHEDILVAKLRPGQAARPLALAAALAPAAAALAAAAGPATAGAPKRPCPPPVPASAHAAAAGAAPGRRLS